MLVARPFVVLAGPGAGATPESGMSLTAGPRSCIMSLAGGEPGAAWRKLVPPTLRRAVAEGPKAFARRAVTLGFWPGPGRWAEAGELLTAGPWPS